MFRVFNRLRHIDVKSSIAINVYHFNVRGSVVQLDVKVGRVKVNIRRSSDTRKDPDKSFMVEIRDKEVRNPITVEITHSNLSPVFLTPKLIPKDLSPRVSLVLWLNIHARMILSVRENHIVKAVAIQVNLVDSCVDEK